MTRFSFARLDDGSWGVKAQGMLGAATGFSGRTVWVTKRDGSSKEVTLFGRVASANGGRSAWYTIQKEASK